MRETVGLLEAAGHRVEDSSPIDPGLAESLDLEDTFLTRWAAGQAASLDQFSILLGREIEAHEVEPLTWALAEIGRERSSGRYLRDVAIHQTVARAIAAWHESGFDLLLTPTMSEPPVPLGTYDDSGPDPMAAFRRAVPPGPSPRSSTPPASRRPRCRCTGPRRARSGSSSAPLGREDLLIRVAAQLERRARGGPPPPVFARAILRHMAELRGVITAMVTPFAADGAVDVDATRRLARYLIDNGSHGLVVAGTTGESPTLSDDEKLRLFDIVLDEVGDEATVIAGTGSNDPPRAG